MATIQPGLQDLKDQRRILDTQIEIAELVSSIETKVKQLRSAGKNEVEAIKIRSELAQLQEKLSSLGGAPQKSASGGTTPVTKTPAPKQPVSQTTPPASEPAPQQTSIVNTTATKQDDDQSKKIQKNRQDFLDGLFGRK